MAKKTKRKNKVKPQKNINRILLGTVLVLMVPLIAMQFSDEWDWKLADFVIVGGLLLVTGLTYEFVKTKIDKKYWLILAIGLVVAFLLVWAELAVGIFGTPFAGS